MNAAPMTTEAIEKACSGTLALAEPWRRMTRADASVAPGSTLVILHGPRGAFSLWEAVSC